MPRSPSGFLTATACCLLCSTFSHVNRFYTVLFWSRVARFVMVDRGYVDPLKEVRVCVYVTCTVPKPAMTVFSVERHKGIPCQRIEEEETIGINRVVTTSRQNVLEKQGKNETRLSILFRSPRRGINARRGLGDVVKDSRKMADSEQTKAICYHRLDPSK
ncbi:hypothetical protein WN48_03391 [Eufriesea mexicana]|uniref:Uncharacterized protein n=1 Tax=Eufriesea mexicana TaxID=516756 RepID=A0A310SFF2_9HYME|nr:hypothetical protein WN48_03391 [Eufriesea mexicana]